MERSTAVAVGTGEVTLNLVCGPDGPLPDSRSRYRLLSHLGTGGQAEVYRGVRISAGLRSSPVSVKVFRAVEGEFSRADQLAFWDKGDAVLMDLNSRNVPSICLRVDGFYGAPPRAEGADLADADHVPFQVLDYLPGATLIDRLRDDVAASATPSLSGLSILQTLARTLAVLHRPAEEDLAVLHMDVKPANVLIAPDGQAHLIDFTASRYHDSAHLTSVAHSPESGGPEAKLARDQIGPAYDVHGFGAVAYYLVTGWHPRTEENGRSSLRRHPLLDTHPMVARHLLAPLADAPGDRPKTSELEAWATRLSHLMRQVPMDDHLVHWETTTNRATKIAPARPRSTDTAVFPVLGDETRRPRVLSGSAAVPAYHPPQPNYHDYQPQWAPPPPTHHPMPPRRPPIEPVQHSRGRGLVALSVMWFLLCWVVWLATDFFKTQSANNALLGLAFASVGAIGVYWLTRMAGYLLRTTLELRRGRSTFIPNLTTSIFLLTCGVSVLSFTPLDIRRLIELFTGG